MSTSAFFSPETASLERNVEVTEEKVTFDEIWTERNRSKCLDWIESNKFEHVCLQFPDNYLPFSAKIHDSLKGRAKIYILADTSYGSCCVDEVAASHVDADAIIHFGNACQSKVSRLPVLYVFPQKNLDLTLLKDQISKLDEAIKLKPVTLYLGQDYHHLFKTNDDKKTDNSSKELNEVKQSLEEAGVSELSIKKYPYLKENKTTDVESVIIFVGRDGEHFFNLTMTENASNWFLYDPEEKSMKEINPIATSFIRKRYYYIEKCKDAKSIGIVVATLSAEGYLDIVKHIKQLASANGIRSYIISVGRINAAKLANFMEIDCFVLVGCPFNNIYTSKEFYKPMVSVFEAELALNPAWLSKFPEKYVTDFNDLLPNGAFYNEIIPENIPKNDVSLVTGKIRNPEASSSEDLPASGALMERKNYQLAENGGRTIEDRSWRGLEQKLGATEPAVVEKGRTGIPILYTDD